MVDQQLARGEPAAAEAGDPVVVLNRNLMFGVQIANVVRALGFAPRFVPDTDAFIAEMRRCDPRPVLGILDMNGPIDWEAISALAGEPDGSPLLGFGPHVDVAGRRAAKAAGLTRIVSNGEFHRGMGEVIGRYARAGAGSELESGV